MTRPCRITGCPRDARTARTLCDLHRRRLRIHGDPDFTTWTHADQTEVELLVRHGITFHAGCCTDAGPRPRRLREVEGFIEGQARKKPVEIPPSRFEEGKRLKQPDEDRGV